MGRAILAGIGDFVKSLIYFATTSTTKVFGSVVGHGCGLDAVGAGGGPNWAVTTKTLCVLASSAMVRAPFWVFTFSATMNLLGDSSLTTVNTASCPHDAKASPV